MMGNHTRMNQENDKSKYVTEEYLDKRLDERLGEQTQVILNAVDSMLTKRLSEIKGRSACRHQQ